MQGAKRPPESMEFWMPVARRVHFRVAFPTSAVCLPGEKARWIAQSEYASAMAAGDKPAVRRAREEWTMLSNVAERRSSGSGGLTVTDDVMDAPSRPSIFVKSMATANASALAEMGLLDAPRVIVSCIVQ